MKSTTYFIQKRFILLSLVVASLCYSCSDFNKFELPEANSIADETPPTANFSYTQGAEDDWQVYTFGNLSDSSVDYAWDFGDGNTSTGKDVQNTYAEEGTYTVTLMASDALGKNDTYSENITVMQPEVPAAINPTILNGDFEAGQDDWKFSDFSGGTTSPFNSSSDGSNLNYDGTDNGSKTAGAKWTSGTSAGPYVSASTRYAYQALEVSPNSEYFLEYEYAIKDDGTQAPDGNRIVGSIIDGHFADGVDGVASFAVGPLVSHVGTEDLGKGNFTTVKEQFTSNASGEIAIFIFGVTDVDAYVDNVKVYPVE